ncbi:hypothetical protein F511_00434 [Dorcoceras hygrometricum]|uniref:Chromo domain-containing protein n=1 Tax=Dorcoceras hygrometricum TaxID=472368 RepID=A0A2Z7BBK4_9LAMI|nr:hypothetical protein F511_00434 [Dorcoceras hygrometricum]
MTKYANNHRRDLEFKEGDSVFLKLRPHRQQSVCSRIFQKLSPRYYGPYEILQRVGKVAYKLKLPAGSRVHPVFHASQLKKALGHKPQLQELPAEMEQDLANYYKPSKILAHREKKQAGVMTPQVLVQWKDKPVEEATWEDAADFASQFPEADLGDKVVVKERGVDRGVIKNQEDRPRPIITNVYSRRPRAQ